MSWKVANAEGGSSGCSSDAELTETSAVHAITWVDCDISQGQPDGSSRRMNHLGPAYVVLYRSAGGATMLFTIAVILLVIALVLFVVGLVSGRRTV